MQSLLHTILDNERITDGLDDEEARLLIEWLVAQVESGTHSHGKVVVLCRYARAIARFVALWCHERMHGPALQLAASERFTWPLPIGDCDAGDLMARILEWEERRPIMNHL